MLTLFQRLMVLLAIIGQTLGALGVPILIYSQDGNVSIEQTPCGCPLDAQEAKNCCCFTNLPKAPCGALTLGKPEPVAPKKSCCESESSLVSLAGKTPQTMLPKKSCCESESSLGHSKSGSTPVKKSSCCEPQYAEKSSCCEPAPFQPKVETQTVKIVWQAGLLVIKARCQGQKDLGGSPISGSIGVEPDSSLNLEASFVKETWNRFDLQRLETRQENPPAPPPKEFARTLANATALVSTWRVIGVLTG